MNRTFVLLFMLNIIFHFNFSLAHGQESKDEFIVHHSRIKTNLYLNDKLAHLYQLQIFLDDKLLLEVGSKERWPTSRIAAKFGKAAMMGQNFKFKKSLNNWYPCENLNNNQWTFSCSLLDDKLLEFVNEPPSDQDSITFVEDFSNLSLSIPAKAPTIEAKEVETEVDKICHRLKTEHVSKDTLSLIEKILTLAQK